MQPPMQPLTGLYASVVPFKCDVEAYTVQCNDVTADIIG